MKIKYPAPYSKNWAFCNYIDIPSTVDKGNVYLRRFRVVQTPWFSFLVHWIYEPDSDRDPHDHPWRFISFVWRGGYTECVVDNLGDLGRDECRERWSVHSMSLDKAHRITSVIPNTVTVVLTGRRQQVFSFWTKNGRVPWHEYVNSSSDDVTGKDL